MIVSIGLLSMSVLNSGCSDSADADVITTGAMCMPGDVLLNPTPEAPMAACSVPPSPYSSLIEAGATAQAVATETRRAELLDPSRITVVTCGTGSPFPSERAQSCLAVFVNGKFLLFDAGDRAQNSIENLNLPVMDIETVFLTHFHSDHIADLGEVVSRSWILGRTQPIEIYGGPEVEQVVNGFNLVYAADEIYRVEHHGEAVFPNPTAATAVVIERPGPEGRVVYESDGVSVLAYSVDHSPIGTALGYRIEYAGKVVAISGDTIDTPGLHALAANADVFVSEVMNKGAVEDMECAFGRIPDSRLEKIFADIRSYHIDLPELAQLASDADVATLVMTHLVPAPLSPVQGDAFFSQPAAAIFGGTIVLAEDGTEVVIRL
tara:strand:+ start:2909 stop:4042 length:1134 start_codon:yes stop_codon:yes gene_type:complete